MKRLILFSILLGFLGYNLLFAAKLETIAFKRVEEPREKAFSLMIPTKWQTEGGIFRVDPSAQGGPSQSIAAKLDFSVKKDASGSVMIRWLPDVLYYDARYSPAGQMGMFPPGSNYQGMTVYPLMSAEQFLRQIVFPYAHPNATQVKVLKVKLLADVANSFKQRVSAMIPQSTFSYDAALMHVNYMENGKKFTEKMVCVIENWGQMGAGMWGNKETFIVRTPVGKFQQWEPVFSIIQNSVKLSLSWVKGELQGQIRRGEIALQTQRQVQEIGRQITEHRQKTNAEIHNDMFLTLNEQEEYVNPYTKEVDVGSNQWNHRWVNESGEVIYTDKEGYNPNTDVNLKRSDYKRTPIRKRHPQ